MSGSTPTTSASETWVWNPTLGVYYHAASNTYALPSAGEWTYLTPAELAARGGSGLESGMGGAGASSSTATGAHPSEDMEEGEVEDDVGWGGLMDPDKLARVVASKDRATSEGRIPFAAEREWDRGRDRDSSGRHVYGNGHDPYGRGSSGFADHAADGRPSDTRGSRSPTPPPDPAAHILRLVVRRSKALPHGGIALLDARPGGIQIGRDRRGPGDGARLRVREMEVSKTHAVIYWGREGKVDLDSSSGDEGWWIVDLGSTLGTYVAHRGEGEATRLSEPKHSSPPFAIQHLSRVTVGTTTFVAHIHADWPCGECQLAGSEEIRLEDGDVENEGTSTPGDASPAPAAQFDPPVGAAQRRGQRQFKRKLALDALRDTLLGDEDKGPAARKSGAGAPSTGANAIGGSSSGYLDRSAQRRRLHPPSPPHLSSERGRQRDGGATISAPAQPAGPSAVSRAMLARQGWTPGAGLGRDASGRAEPVVAVIRSERVGLGARGQVADTGDAPGAGDWRARGKQRRWDEVARS